MGRRPRVALACPDPMSTTSSESELAFPVPVAGSEFEQPIRRTKLRCTMDADLERELQREMEVQEVVRKLQAPPTAPGEAGPSQAPPGGAGQPPVIRDNADLDGILAFLMSD